MAVSCGSCGAEVETDWQFCRSCGAALDEVDGQAQAEDTGAAGTMPESDAREQRDGDTDTDTDTSGHPGGLTAEEARARRQVTAALFIGLAVLVALVIVGLVVLELGR